MSNSTVTLTEADIIRIAARLDDKYAYVNSPEGFAEHFGGRKIAAIKAIRTVTNWGLRDSKEYVEQLFARCTPANRALKVLKGVSAYDHRDVILDSVEEAIRLLEEA